MSLWILTALISALGIGGALVFVVQALVNAGKDAASKIAALPDSTKVQAEAAKTADAETEKAVSGVQNATPDDLLARARELRDLGKRGK